MPEKEKERKRFTKAKKTPPPEPFRINRPVATDAKKVPPPEHRGQFSRKEPLREIKKAPPPERRTKPKEKKDH